jgi:hypothetical protein
MNEISTNSIKWFQCVVCCELLLIDHLLIFSNSQDSKRPIYEEIRIDPLFRKINKHSVGFHVFKIENDHIEALAKDQVGIFFDENVYIIYASAVKGSYSDQKTIVSYFMNEKCF